MGVVIIVLPGVSIYFSDLILPLSLLLTYLVISPGHADYVKNMITGAAQMDGGILVVGK